MVRFVRSRSVLAVRDLSSSTKYYPDEVDASATGNHSHRHREFVVETPDGHRILFGEPID